MKGKTEEIRQMGKDLISPSEISRRTKYSQGYVVIILNKAQIYTVEEVKRLIRKGEKTDKQIAKEGNVNIEAVRRVHFQEEENQKKQELIIELGKNVKKIEEIKKEVGCGISSIYRVLRTAGVYTYPKVIKLINEREKTDEQIALEGNVYVEAVRNIRTKGKEQKANQEKTKLVIKLAKNVRSVEEIKQKVGCGTTFVYRVLRREGVYTYQRVIDLIDEGEKTDEQIAEEGNVYVEAVRNVRTKRTEHTKTQKEPKSIIKLAKNVKSIEEIIEKTGYGIASVYRILRIEGVYTYQRVINLIDEGEKTDEQIAEEGNVYAEAVRNVRTKRKEKDYKDNERLTEYKNEVETKIELNNEDLEQKRREIEEEEKSKIEAETKRREQQRKCEEKRVIELAKNIMAISEIAVETRHTEQYITSILEKAGIYNREKVKELIKRGKKSDEQIALEGKVNVESVRSLRIQMDSKNKSDRKSVEEASKSQLLAQKILGMISIRQKRIEKEVDDKDKEKALIRMAKKFASIEQMQNRLEMSEYYIRRRMLEEGIASINEVIEQILTTTKADNEIAKETNGNEDAIRDIGKITNWISKLMESNRIKSEIKTLIKMITTNSDIRLIKRMTGLSYEEIQVVKMELAREQKMQKVPEERKRVNYKIQMTELKTYINFRVKNPEIINVKIDKLLVEFANILTVQDYVTIAKVYENHGEHLKALEFGERYLGLEELTTSGLQQKIKEISEKNEMSI